MTPVGVTFLILGVIGLVALIAVWILDRPKTKP